MFVVVSLLSALAMGLASAGPNLTSLDFVETKLSDLPTDRGLILTLLAGKKLYNCACGQPNRNSRIIGGESSDIHEFPWFADVVTQGTLAGAGALINDRYVITAATIVKGMTPYDVKVTLGAHDRCLTDATSASMSVVDIRIHEDYDFLTKANDVALVRLGNPVKFQREISPVCLSGPTSTFRGQVATVLSWGQDDVLLIGVGTGSGIDTSAGGGDEDGDEGGSEEGGDGDDEDTEDGDDDDDDDDDDDYDEYDEDDDKKKKKKKKITKKKQKRTQRQDEVVVNFNCRARKVGLPVLERVQCARAVDGLLFTPDKGCVGILNVPAIVCATDAGGPVQFRGHSGIYELIGVLSGSNDCVDSSGPALYSRISQYLKWISTNTRDAYYCSA